MREIVNNFSQNLKGVGSNLDFLKRYLAYKVPRSLSILDRITPRKRNPRVLFAAFDLLEKGVRPLIAEDKPMLYPASGDDLGAFLSTGVSEAYFVDPVFSEKGWETGYCLNSLVKKIKFLGDKPSVDLAVDDNMVTVGEIRFRYSGRRKVIHIVGRDGINYVPEELSSKGCSVYFTFGSGVGELNIPITHADVYVVPLSFPHSWGFADVTRSDYYYYNFSIASRYDPLSLTSKEIKVLMTLEGCTPVIKSTVKDIAEGKIDKLRWCRLYRDVMGVKQADSLPIEELILKSWEKSFAVVQKLNPTSRQACINDISSYIEQQFSNQPTSLENDFFKKSMLQVLNNNR